MTTPDIITPVSGSSPRTDVGGAWETGVYQYNSTDGTKEIYSLSFPQADGSYTNMGINSAIYVETSGSNANTWYDYTLTSIPGIVTDTGTQIILSKNDGGLMITLPKPTTASWISSGGGPGTLGGATLQWEGSFTKNPGNDMWRWNVTGFNTDSTDYMYLYDEMPVLGNNASSIALLTFSASSTPTSQYGLFTPDLTKTYYIINFLAGSSSTNLNEVVVASKNFAKKKVFANFW
jgi:hypothetical protein